MTNHLNHLVTAPEEPLPAYSTRPSSFDQPRALEEARERATTASTERIASPLPVYHGRLTIREVASERSSLSHAPFYGRPRRRWTLRSGRKKRDIVCWAIGVGCVIFIFVVVFAFGRKQVEDSGEQTEVSGGRAGMI